MLSRARAGVNRYGPGALRGARAVRDTMRRYGVSNRAVGTASRLANRYGSTALSYARRLASL